MVQTEDEIPYHYTEESALEWLSSPLNSPNTYLDKDKPHAYTFRSGSYAEVFRGNSFHHIAPFVARTDSESDQAWAEFTVDAFYGKKGSPYPWDWPSIKIMWMPLDKSDKFCKEIAGGGFLIRVDEAAKCQMPMTIELTDDERQKILKNNRMVGQALLLKSTLTNYEKPQTNWTFILYIVIILLLIVAVWAAWQAGLLNGVIGFVSNIGKGISIPAPPPH